MTLPVRVGIDTYSYHRYFGEIRPGEDDPGVRWTTWQFVDRAAALGVDGVSLETCFLPSGDAAFYADLADRLDDAGLERVLAWGHPGGLEMGKSDDQYRDLLDLFEHAVTVDSPLVRIVVGTFTHWRAEPEADSIERLVPRVRAACREAAGYGLALAIETHCALTVEGLRQLVDVVAAPNLGVVLDTANVVRVGADLEDATRLLAPHTRMLHVKDLLMADADRGDPGGWWPSVPLGQGDLELEQSLDLLAAAGFAGMACVELATLPPGMDEDDAVAESVAWLRERYRRY